MEVYPCKYCFKDFILKSDYDEHKITCELIKKRKDLRKTQLDRIEDDIPNPRMMFELIKILTAKCDRLEDEVRRLRERTQREQRKIDILQYLNHQAAPPPKTFKTWLKEIQVERESIETTIENNIIKGVCNILESEIYEDNLPLTAFSHKRNIIYVYEYVSSDSNKADWTIMTEKMQNDMFDTLSNRMLKAYNKWESEQPSLVQETEANINIKTKYRQKILGLSICDETKYRKFSIWLFNALKKSAMHITEYEFV